MPAHKAIPSFRNLRQIALEKGTAPAGFDGDVAQPEAGYAEQYDDRAKAALPPPAAAIQDADPQPVPFKLR